MISLVIVSVECSAGLFFFFALFRDGSWSISPIVCRKRNAQSVTDPRRSNRVSVATRQDEKQVPNEAAVTTAPTITEETTVPIIYVEADDTEKEVQAPIGRHLLEVAHDNNVELEGACGGELACSTCHLIFEKEIYDQLPEKLDDEEDMLDLAFGVTET